MSEQPIDTGSVHRRAGDDGRPEPVRRALLLKAALEVMANAGVPLSRVEVLRQVEEDLDLTDYERAPYREGVDEPRWSNHLTWGTTDMKAAGWMTKDRGMWAITDAGREALATHPDGVGLDVEAGRAYREQRRAAQGPDADERPTYRQILPAAMEAVEAGTWTTYEDLADVARTNVQTVGWATRELDIPDRHRVLGKGGRPVSGFVWSDESRTETQREALEAEGVTFDATGSASEGQRIRAADLRAFLEERGVLETLPRRAWRVRVPSAFGYDLVPTWLNEGYVSLPASKLRALDPGISRSDLKDIVDEDYAHASYASRAAKLDEFHAFLSRMRVDDVVAVTSQGQLYLGTLSSGAEYVKSSDGMSNLRRSVDWSSEGYDFGDLAPELTARLQVQYDVVELTPQLDLLEEMLAAEESDLPPAPVHRDLVLPDATDELAEALNVSRAWLQECIELLRDRPQLIFYGPPGTGKTYIAQHLAQHLAGDNVRLTQFHPAYSYEDFFEGYRPVKGGGFDLRPGPLRKTVDAAIENPSTPYFLIIDEINRGNLAKIFGELYFLLEYRSENVELLYDVGDSVGFSMPENVFIIGTMNTADRSIALVDAAMRRRFAFIPLHPSEPPTNTILRRWLEKEGHDVAVADLLEELNARIEDPDFKIGPSYFMRRAVHEAGGLDRAWRTAILPLLEEHHYGDGTEVVQRYGLDTIRARVAQKRQAAQVSDEPADTE